MWENAGSLGNPGPIAFSCVEGGASGTANISSDPLFVRPASSGLDGLWGTSDDDLGDLRLHPGSPCIDEGDNTLYAFGNHDDPATVDTGLAGLPSGLSIISQHWIQDPLGQAGLHREQQSGVHNAVSMAPPSRSS